MINSTEVLEAALLSVSVQPIAGQYNQCRVLAKRTFDLFRLCLIEVLYKCHQIVTIIEILKEF